MESARISLNRPIVTIHFIFREGMMDGCEEKKILVVEDDKHLNKMMAYLFRAKGYSVEIASSGLEALEILKTFTPNIIVLDILMPRMNGFEFMNKIQEDLPLNNVPVIILSALPSHMNKDKAFAMGAIDYINKPFRSAELMIRIEEVIKENNENSAIPLNERITG